MRELKILEERYLLSVSSRTSGASRLLDATKLRVRIAECRAETGPAIDNVGEIGFDEVAKVDGGGGGVGDRGEGDFKKGKAGSY